MSIYCSFGSFDDDFPNDSQPPLAYRKSHVLPSPDDPRGGSFDLGYIPGFITRDGHDPESVEGIDNVWPYLRVSLNGTDEEPDTVVLDLEQVNALIDHLTRWRDRVKPEPR